MLQSHLCQLVAVCYAEITFTVFYIFSLSLFFLELNCLYLKLLYLWSFYLKYIQTILSVALS